MELPPPDCVSSSAINMTIVCLNVLNQYSLTQSHLCYILVTPQFPAHLLPISSALAHLFQVSGFATACTHLAICWTLSWHVYPATISAWVPLC